MEKQTRILNNLSPSQQRQVLANSLVGVAPHLLVNFLYKIIVYKAIKVMIFYKRGGYGTKS